MNTAPPATLRDPALRGRLTLAVVALAVLWPLLVVAEFRPWQLLGGDAAPVMATFLAAFWPPETSAAFVSQLFKATLETLAIATSGLFLAFLVAVPLAVCAARTLDAARLGGAGQRRLGAVRRAAVRTVLTALRAIPEVVWALVFVRALGLGPGAGVLALAVTYGGMLGKVYTEILESGDTRPARALLEAGSARTGVLLYALVPGAAPELASYTVYRWECAVRASVVMGFVGAGGLGQLMDQSVKMLAGGEASAILAAFLLLVLVADGLSVVVRRVLA